VAVAKRAVPALLLIVARYDILNLASSGTDGINNYINILINAVIHHALLLFYTSELDGLPLQTAGKPTI
jgi:hypothetical protein